MKIADMHPEIREALLDSGLDLSDSVTPEEALVAWSGYEIGDCHWVEFMLEQLTIMRAHEKISPCITPISAMTLMASNGFTMLGFENGSYHWPDTRKPITAQIGSRTWVSNDMGEWREI